jgi:hypothetical protein
MAVEPPERLFRRYSPITGVRPACMLLGGPGVPGVARRRGRCDRSARQTQTLRTCCHDRRHALGGALAIDLCAANGIAPSRRRRPAAALSSLSPGRPLLPVRCASLHMEEVPDDLCAASREWARGAWGGLAETQLNDASSAAASLACKPSLHRQEPLTRTNALSHMRQRKVHVVKSRSAAALALRLSCARHQPWCPATHVEGDPKRSSAPDALDRHPKGFSLLPCRAVAVPGPALASNRSAKRTLALLRLWVCEHPSARSPHSATYLGSGCSHAAVTHMGDDPCMLLPRGRAAAFAPKLDDRLRVKAGQRPRGLQQRLRMRGCLWQGRRLQRWAGPRVVRGRDGVR